MLSFALFHIDKVTENINGLNISVKSFSCYRRYCCLTCERVVTVLLASKKRLSNMNLDTWGPDRLHSIHYRYACVGVAAGIDNDTIVILKESLMDLIDNISLVIGLYEFQFITF